MEETKDIWGYKEIERLQHGDKYETFYVDDFYEDQNRDIFFDHYLYQNNVENSYLTQEWFQKAFLTQTVEF